jgi:hypothetical protein
MTTPTAQVFLQVHGDAFDAVLCFALHLMHKLHHTALFICDAVANKSSGRILAGWYS